MPKSTTNEAARPPMGAREIARRSPNGLELRGAPVHVRWDFSDLTTSDGHRLRCSFDCSVQPNDRPADRRMLMEALLSGRDAVSADDVARHFEPALRSAATRVSSLHGVEQILADDGAAHPEMLDALRNAANANGFATGLDILPPFHLELHSPTHDRERMEAMQRRLVERRAAGQVEHVQRAADLLKQFRSLRDAAPELSPGRLLERVSTTDRGTMLEALLLASDDGGDAPPLWAVAGPALVRIDSIGGSSQPRVETIDLPTTLGPFRSVSGATVDSQRVLLIGARSGVMVVDPNDPTGARSYAAPDSGSQLGFNSAVAWGGKLLATHREVGLVVWAIDRQGEPVEVDPDTGLAHLRVLAGDRIVYSRGTELRGRTHGGEFHPIELGPEPIVGIVAHGGGCIVVSASGEVVALASDGAAHLTAQRRCGRVRTAAALPWLGDSRLLLATDDGPVCCVGVDDSLVTQYVSPHRGLKALAATPGLVAGVTGDRQRIVLWHSWDGTRPVAELHVGALTKHRVADLCFV